MAKLRAIIKRLMSFFRPDRRDADLAAELESHLQFHIEDNLRAGMSPEEARRQALIKLGGLEQTKESVRAQRVFPWLDSLLQDTRFALRMLRRISRLHRRRRPNSGPRYRRQHRHFQGR